MKNRKDHTKKISFNQEKERRSLLTRKRIIWIALMIIVMDVIFYFSNQSAEKSHAVSNAVAEEVKMETNYGWEESSSMPLLFGLNLRKWAHVALFGLLGLTTWFGFKSLWISLAISYTYACFDEIHQMFVSGRTANITDTFIDAIGFGSVVLICFIASRLYRNGKGE